MVATNRKSATTRLEPGQNSIDRVTPRRPDEDGPWLLDWSIRLPDGRLLTKRSQAPTKGAVRQKAKATAAELLSGGSGGVWKVSAPMTDYLRDVSGPAIENARLREQSKRQYRRGLALLAGTCDQHRHADSLKGHSIGTATRFRALENCLKEIARLHGSESAHQARTVLSKYVIQQLIRDELIKGNPLYGMSIDLSSPKQPAVSRGGQSLSRDQWRKLLDHLLALDPAEGIERPKRGRFSLADRIAVRRNLIDLTLFQATTGLRVSEANEMCWSDVRVTDDGEVIVPLSEEASKTHKGLLVQVIDPRVAERLLMRPSRSTGTDTYVIGSPADAHTRWDRDNCRKAVARFYVELGQALGIELLGTGRTHVWRTTLNHLTAGFVPEAERAAWFGHSQDVNRKHYNDYSDTARMVEAGRRLLSDDEEPTV